MKKLNKLLALALAVILTLSLCTGVFAANGDITISFPEGRTYKVYQIFTGDVATDESGNKTLSNVKWGADGTGTTGEAVPEATLTTISALADDEGATAEAIKGYCSANDATYTSAADYTGAPGYYLIEDITAFADDATDTYKSLHFIAVFGDVEVEVKGDKPEVIKKILEDGTILNCADPDNHTSDEDHTEDCYEEAELKLDANDAAIGDYVKYEFTGTLPETLADYDTYYYVFHDTLSKGLTYVNDTNHPLTVKIVNKVNNADVATDVTSYFHKDAVVGTDSTAITVGVSDILAFNVTTETQTAPICTVDKDSKIVVTYWAQVNKDAVIGGANTNEVKLEYSNDPNDDGNGATTPPSTNPAIEKNVPTGETPKDITITYVTKVKVIKVDGDDNRLIGAEFTLTGEALNQVYVYKETFTEAGENATGTLYYKLLDGTYTTAAPTAAGSRLATAEERQQTSFSGNDDYGYTDEECTSPATQEQWEDVNNTLIYIKVEGNADLYADTTKQYVKSSTFEQKAEKGEDDSISAAAFVDDAGVVEFTGLKAGTYTLTESVTPAGYNTVAPITFTIDWAAPATVTTGEETCTWTVGTDTASAASGVAFDANENTFKVIIENQKGSTLPETGGIGTTIFYVIGGILLVGAAVLLITKKRMGVEA